MVKIIIFGIIAILIFIRFKGELRDSSKHGFFMFFAFEAILVLFYFNFRWGEAFAWQRICAGILLTVSALIAISGFLRSAEIWKSGGRLGKHYPADSERNLLAISAIPSIQA